MAVPNAVLLQTVGDGQMYFGQPVAIEELSPTTSLVTSDDGSQVVIDGSFAATIATADAVWGGTWRSAVFELVSGLHIVFAGGAGTRVWPDENAPLSRCFATSYAGPQNFGTIITWHVKLSALAMASVLWP